MRRNGSANCGLRGGALTTAICKRVQKIYRTIHVELARQVRGSGDRARSGRLKKCSSAPRGDARARNDDNGGGDSTVKARWRHRCARRPCVLEDVVKMFVVRPSARPRQAQAGPQAPAARPAMPPARPDDADVPACQKFDHPQGCWPGLTVDDDDIDGWREVMAGGFSFFFPHFSSYMVENRGCYKIDMAKEKPQKSYMFHVPARFTSRSA